MAKKKVQAVSFDDLKKAVARFKDMGVNVYNYSFPMYDTPTGRIVGGPYLGKSYIGPGWFAEQLFRRTGLGLRAFCREHICSAQKSEVSEVFLL